MQRSNIITRSTLLLTIVTLAACGGSSASGDTGGDASPSASVPTTASVAGISALVIPDQGTASMQITLNANRTATVTCLPLAQSNGDAAGAATTQTVPYTLSNSNAALTVNCPVGTSQTLTLAFSSSTTLAGVSVAQGATTIDARAIVASSATAIDAATALDTGRAALAARDLTAAEAQFCDGLIAAPTNGGLAFGCLWTRLLRLPESDGANAIYNSFGEPDYDVETGMLSDDGIFAKRKEIRHSSLRSMIRHLNVRPITNYSHFPTLPMAALLTKSGKPKDQVYIDLLTRLQTSGTMTDDLLRDLATLRASMADITALAKIAVSDAGFAFVIPKELMHGFKDVTVTRNDVRFMVAAGLSYQSLTDVLLAYDPGVDVSKPLVNGAVDADVFVADLNGTGETINGVTVDTTAFLTLVDATRMTSSKQRFVESLQWAIGGINELSGLSESQFAGAFLGRNTLENKKARLSEVGIMLNDLITSATTGMTDVRVLRQKQFDFSTRTYIIQPPRIVRMNLAKLFDTPPSATTTDISAGDPFVLEADPFNPSRKRIKPVERYFKTFLNGIVEFK